MDAIKMTPPAMRPWNLRIEAPVHDSLYGSYILVEVEQADIEQHHQVIVLDEDEQPLRNVWVIFGFGSGKDYGSLMPDVNHWIGAPVVLTGNARRTDAAGYAQHTFGEGGETIFIWDVHTVRESNQPWYSELSLPSTMVKNCTWQRPPVGMFEHTGIRLTFQRQKVGVVTQRDQLAELEQRIKNLEALFADVSG